MPGNHGSYFNYYYIQTFSIILNTYMDNKTISKSEDNIEKIFQDHKFFKKLQQIQADLDRSHSRLSQIKAQLEQT